MDKIGRNYKLTLESNEGTILQISPPLSLEFDITRNILSSANTASFRIYNLSPTNRSKIRRDQFDWGTFRRISLNAGYGENNLPIVFDGTMSQAWSVREGTAFVTQIECYDGGFAQVNGIINESYPSGTQQKSVIKNMIGKLPKVKEGKIGTFDGKLSRGNSYSGNTTDVLRDLTGGGFFIDNSKAHALGDNECLQGEIPIINSASGLLGTPVLEQTFLTFDILFEPRLLIGQLITLESITANNFNGQYKVISVKHRGMISGAVSGDCRTTVGLAYGVKALTVVT